MLARPAWIARKVLRLYRVLLTRLGVGSDLLQVVAHADEHLLGVAEPRKALAIVEERIGRTSDPRFLELDYIQAALLYEALHEYGPAVANWERARDLPATWSPEFDAQLSKRLQRLRSAQ